MGRGGPVVGQVHRLWPHAAHQRQHMAVVIQRHGGGLGAQRAVKLHRAAVALAGAQRAVGVAGGGIARCKHRAAVRVQRQAGVIVSDLTAGGDIGGNGLVPPQGREIAVLAVVLHHGLQRLLQVQVHRGVDAQPAAGQLVGGLLLADALLFHQVLHHLPVQCVGKVRVDAVPVLADGHAAPGQHPQRGGGRLVIVRPWSSISCKTQLRRSSRASGFV